MEEVWLRVVDIFLLDLRCLLYAKGSLLAFVLLGILIEIAQSSLVRLDAQFDVVILELKLHDSALQLSELMVLFLRDFLQLEQPLLDFRIEELLRCRRSASEKATL